MNQITRCPFCETKFKVVPDQLRISEGWVRCGQCKQIFDAAEHLELESVPSVAKETIPESSAPAPLLAPPPPPPAAEPEPEPEPLLPPQPQGYELPSAPLPELDLEWFDASELDFGPKPKPEPELQTPTVPEPAPVVPTPAPVPDLEPVLASHSGAPKNPLGIEPFLSLASVATAPLPPSERQEPYLLAEADLGQAPPPAPAKAAAAPPIDKKEWSFVRAAGRKVFWHHTPVHTGLVVVGFLLLCGLVLQVLVHQRNTIAATRPQWRPLLQTVCVPLRCKIGAYRKIASIVVESSSFNKIKDDEYQFSITLKNRSPVPIAMPAIELTLTDPNDEPVLRRVFTPEDLQAPAEISAQGEWSTSLSARLSTGSSMLASGYRVLAFYP